LASEPGKQQLCGSFCALLLATLCWHGSPADARNKCYKLKIAICTQGFCWLCSCTFCFAARNVQAENFHVHTAARKLQTENRILPVMFLHLLFCATKRAS
jgi:hypothetical protein